MKLAVLSTTLRENEFLEPMKEFRQYGLARGHQCCLVRYGELGVALEQGMIQRLWGPGSQDLLEADLVIPRLSIRRISRGDFYVLDLLEHCGILFLNPIEAIEAARNKVTTIHRLHQAGLPIPPTVVVRQMDRLADSIKMLGNGPWVVKPSMGSKGRDIVKVAIMEELREVFKERWAEDRNEILMVQQFVESSGECAWDIRVFTLLGQVVGAMRRTSVTGDFRSNFSLGGDIETFPLNEDMELLALKAASVMDLDLSGVDIIISPQGPRILEVNANPGWEGISHAMKKSGENFFERFLNILEQHVH